MPAAWFRRFGFGVGGDALVGRFGRVDVVCNNAGVSTFNLFERQTLDDWAWVFAVNLWGVVHGIQAFLPIMRSQGTPGHVVNTASAAGIIGAVPYMAPYGASKAAVVSLSETLRAEHLAVGIPIGVSVLCPGFTRTNVLDGQRNRGPQFGSEHRTAASEEVVRSIEQGFSSPVGKEAGEVAERVLEAVLADQFWILSHGGMEPLYQARCDEIVAASPRR